VEGQAVISHDVLASYAADAARDIEGVHRLVGGARRQSGVRVTETDGVVTLEVHVALEWGASAAEVGSTVQRRVSEYVGRTAKLPALAVDVVVAGVAAPTD
jgi:uncharacterized alkaline shock family protein YloU